MAFKDLIVKGGLIKERQIGFDQVERYLKRARKDLSTARKILKIDTPAALDLIYKAMFHSANGLIRFYGLRPGRISQHKAVVEAVGRVLGKPADILVLKFDKLRQKRNYFEYGAGFRSSKEEVKSSLGFARKFLQLVEEHIQKKNPQKKLFER